MKETGPTINEKMIDSGQIRHVFFNFPLAIHPHAPKASEAAECAGKQGRFWEMSESLFADPQKLDVADLVVRSETIGINPALFKKCLDSGETADKIRRDVDEGRRVGVNATPTFFIGSVNDDGSIELVTRLNGALPFEEFEKAVRTLLPGPRQARR
jgi:protein-disulfide isomerase